MLACCHLSYVICPNSGSFQNTTKTRVTGHQTRIGFRVSCLIAHCGSRSEGGAAVGQKVARWQSLLLCTEGQRFRRTELFLRGAAHAAPAAAAPQPSEVNEAAPLPTAMLHGRGAAAPDAARRHRSSHRARNHNPCLCTLSCTAQRPQLFAPLPPLLSLPRYTTVTKNLKYSFHSLYHSYDYEAASRGPGFKRSLRQHIVLTTFKQSKIKSMDDKWSCLSVSPFI